MKIGIITIQKCNNYGADLQAFALQRKIMLMGYDVENIDYLFYKHKDFRKTRRARPSFKLSIVNKAKEWLLPKVNAARSIAHRNIAHERQKAFDDFFQSSVRTSRTYRTIDDLYENPPLYDVYVTGSDQVWNPRMGSSLEPYFLTFAPKGARKISYASSFGVSSLPPIAYKKYSEWLSDYSAISVREESGAKIAKNFIDCVRPNVVLDPTLLLSAAEWRESLGLDSESKDGNYLLVYDLNYCPGLWVLAKKCADKLHLPIKRICRAVGCEKIKGVQNIEAAGPKEFVELVSNAKAVVTTSFHGTAFSVIFGKPFYSVIPNGMTNAGRIESLLSKIDLLECLVEEKNVESAELDHCANDYSERLFDMKKYSEKSLVLSIRGGGAI